MCRGVGPCSFSHDTVHRFGLLSSPTRHLSSGVAAFGLGGTQGQDIVPYGRFVFSLQKQAEPSGVLAGEEPAVRAAAQDNVTEEAIGSPLAMWELEIQNIELEKGEGGLGFSILDYQVRKWLLPQPASNGC